MTGVQTCALPIWISVGYVQKQWTVKENGESSKMGYWDDTKYLSGIQAGIRIEPLFKYGFGRSEERRVGKECRSRWSPYH